MTKHVINTISGNFVDVPNSRIYPGTIHIMNGKITSIVEENKEYKQFILPGMIDAHIHIESSLLVPSEFARLASVHGTVATVSDPHEIGNVLGVKGVEYMIKNARTVPFKFYFGAPSCVPATPFETAGATINLTEIENLFKNKSTRFLSEMMNVPGVLSGDTGVKKKLSLVKKYGLKADGHAPGLRGKDARKYVEAGISTDHECVSIEEGREKLSYGMHIQIREGSAARNFDELMPLIDEYPDQVMFCSDDKHPDDLEKGHINLLVKRALKAGLKKMNILRCACVNPVRHYSLDVGLLQEGDQADFIVIDNFECFTILQTVVNGKTTAKHGQTQIRTQTAERVNHFNAGKKSVEDFTVRHKGGRIRVIIAIDGRLATKSVYAIPAVTNDIVIPDIDRDILKIVVINRYENRPPAVGFIQGFGLKKGAIASSVAHDSHNIVAVGTNDKDITGAVNLIIENQGGVSAVNDRFERILPLPIAGIMSADDGYRVADQYSELDRIAKRQFGSVLQAPFMTLSFMALLVIPELKLSDKGLFDGVKFEPVSLFE